VEHLILLLKKAHKSSHSSHNLETLSLSLDLFLQMDKMMKEEMDIKVPERKTREKVKDIQELAERIYQEPLGTLPKGWTNLAKKGWEDCLWLEKLITNLLNGCSEEEEVAEEEELGGGEEVETRFWE